MRRTVFLAVSLVIGLVFPTIVRPSEDPLDNWPHWRGPLVTGAAARGNPPVHWDEKTNVKWKVAVPGKGSATPIVWNDRVYVLTAVDTKKPARTNDIPAVDPQYKIKTEPPRNYFQFLVLCYDRKSGKLLWQKVATEEVPHEGVQPTHSYAAGSPTTDGKYLYVSFGSRGVYCYDLDGNLQWQKRLGLMHTRFAWGEASTPVIYKDTLIVDWDHEGQSYLYALDARTGAIRWKKDRPEVTTWTTPLVVEHRGRTLIVVNGTKRVRCYDLATGQELWQCGGQTVNAIPSPVTRDGVVYCMSGYTGSAAIAVPLDAQGDITGTKTVLWHIKQGTPYVPSPLLLGDRLYFTQGNNPTLSCVDRATGRVIYRQRLPGLTSLYASPAGIGNRLYITDRDGATLVIQAGDQFKVLATNALDAHIDASPVLAGNQVFLRGHHELYCLEAPGQKTTRILLIGKDRDHPYGSHEYMTECNLLAHCLQQTPGVETIVSNGWPTDPEKLKDVKAIVLYTANGGNVILAPKVRRQVEEMLKAGVGLTAIHWSTGADKLNGPDYQKILGAWFSTKDGSRLNTTITTLIQKAPDHPICRGWKDYRLRDEYYLNLKFQPDITPVIQVQLDGKDYTVGWVYERPGSKGGRSFGFVCGHFHANFGEKEFRQACVNGILWTAHRDVPTAGAPVAITAEDMKLPPPQKK
jgi:outer membrane protein assembly factor BamB/type 1 glutamine amidotransferase